MKNPQRVLLFSYASLAGIACVLCIAAIFLWSGAKSSPEDTAEAELSEAQAAQAADAPAAAAYTVRVWKDGIAVFDSAGELLRTLCVSLSSLSPARRELLQQGIPAADKEALDRLLEDLTS